MEPALQAFYCRLGPFPDPELQIWSGGCCKRTRTRVPGLVEATGPLVWVRSSKLPRPGLGGRSPGSARELGQGHATAVARARCSSAPLHCRLATGLVRRPLHAGAVLREGLGGAAAILRRAPAKRQRRCPHERMACRWRHWRPQRIWWSGSSRRGRLRSNSRDLCRGCRVAR